MTINEMRCIYPSYAEKEQLLQDQAERAERLKRAEKMSLEESRQRGIINDGEKCNHA